MLPRRLVRRAVATAVAAGAGFVAIVSLGAAVFYALALATTPLAAAAITSLAFAMLALFIALVFLRRVEDEDDYEDDEPESLGVKAIQLFRQRPIMGAVAALAGGLIFLKNPALAAMAAAALTEKTGGSPRRRR